MKVESPDGQVWRVSRRWVPWRQRLRDVRELGELVPFPDDLATLIFVVVLIVLAVVAPIVLAVVFAGVELLALLLVLPIAVLGRALFGRQWRVEVRRGWRAHHEELAGDWQRSGLRIHEIADEIRRGELPRRTLGVEDAAG